MNQELKDVQEEFRRKLAEDNRDGLDMVRLQFKKISIHAPIVGCD